MRTILKIAWRNIWRNQRRTLISMSAIGIGLTLVIFYSGLMAGEIGEATEQLDNTGMGHVEIAAPGWREHRRVGESLAAPAALVAGLDLPPTAEVGWRIVGRGLILERAGQRRRGAARCRLVARGAALGPRTRRAARPAPGPRR